MAVTNILCQTKRWFAFSKIGFCAGSKIFEEALNAVKFLVWLKKFVPALDKMYCKKRKVLNVITTTFKVVPLLRKLIEVDMCTSVMLREGGLVEI